LRLVTVGERSFVAYATVNGGAIILKVGDEGKFASGATDFVDRYCTDECAGNRKSRA